MLMYYTNSENNYLIRIDKIENYVSGLTYFNLENMDDYTKEQYQLSGEEYDFYEQKLRFNFSDLSLKEGQQFRATMYNDQQLIWKGSLSVGLNDKSVQKTNYETKLNDTTPEDGDDYIILEN